MATDVPEDDLCLDDLKIGKTLEDACLGQLMSRNNKTDKKIGKRIANGEKAFWTVGQIFKSKMSISTKTRVFQSSIIPILTNGSQTWNLTKKNLKHGCHATMYLRN